MNPQVTESHYLGWTEGTRQESGNSLSS